MGISDFRTIKNENIENCTLNGLINTKRKEPINIYVDGHFYLFSGCLPDNIDRINTGTYNSTLVAASAASVIYSNINKISKYRTINDVFVYFDGKRPSAKKYTSNKRVMSKRIPLNVKDAISKLCRLLNEYNFINNNLLIGESEHEIVLRRDTSIPSMILTDDSDIFHIAYRYETNTMEDQLFIGNKQLNNITDVYKMKDYLKMPKMIFALLCMLRGSDYTKPTFTTSMVNAIIKEYRVNGIKNKYIKDLENVAKTFKDGELAINKKNLHYDSIIFNNLNMDKIDEKYIEGIYSRRDVVKLTKLLLMVLFSSGRKFQFNRLMNIDKIVTHNTVSDFYAQIDTLTWSLNYSLIGSFYINYFRDIKPPESLNPFKFYYLILASEDGDIKYDINTVMNDTQLDYRKLVVQIQKDATN